MLRLKYFGGVGGTELTRWQKDNSVGRVRKYEKPKNTAASLSPMPTTIFIPKSSVFFFQRCTPARFPVHGCAKKAELLIYVTFGCLFILERYQQCKM